MSSTVPARTSSGNPASRTPHRHTPATPPLTNEQQRDQKIVHQILADSEVNRAIHRLRESAADLESLIEEFQDAHMTDMSEVHIDNLGLSNESLSDWADEQNEDVIGFRWALKKFRDMLRPLGDRPADLDDDQDRDDDAQADTPAVVHG